VISKIAILAVVAIVYGLFSPYRWLVLVGGLFLAAYTAYRFIIFKAEEEYGTE